VAPLGGGLADRLATFAVTVWACEVIVSSRANWRFTPSSDVCTWVSAPFTLSTVTLARISNGPTWSATLSRARVAASMVRRSRRIGTASTSTSIRNAPAAISAAICPPDIPVSPHSSHTRSLAPTGRPYRA